MSAPIESSVADKLCQDVHHLASLVGVLGLRWFVIRQALPTVAAAGAETAAMDETVAQLREAVQRLSEVMKQPLPCSSPLLSDAAADEGR